MLATAKQSTDDCISRLIGIKPSEYAFAFTTAQNLILDESCERKFLMLRCITLKLIIAFVIMILYDDCDKCAILCVMVGELCKS